MEPHVDKRTRDDSVYYTVWWSPVVPLTRPVIRGRIPSLPGLFEVYRDEGGRHPELVGRARAYYGGLRNTLRGLIDESNPYPLNGEPLDGARRHFVRYTVLASSDDMDDVLAYYAARTEDEDDFPPSDRYDEIFVKEESLRANGRPR